MSIAIAGMKQFWPVLTAAVSAAILFVLTRSYPAAAELLVIFLFYQAVSLLLRVCRKKLMTGLKKGLKCVIITFN